MPAEVQATFALRSHNPDVLTCMANLSNDEVSTPPEFANRMLDTLAETWGPADHHGANIWADKWVKFLDPCPKSGVFLNEITSRLNKGLATEIPELIERVNHIRKTQVFGIGITYLPCLLARRGVYCSKHARGEHSIAKSFAHDRLLPCPAVGTLAIYPRVLGAFESEVAGATHHKQICMGPSLYAASLPRP